ncbi:MAG: rhodanese-related sulfurtransferase [Buchnera aphidicola (Eriosoma harunire)]
MVLLHNIISNKLLKSKILYGNRVTISFYKYIYINDPVLFRNNIYILFSSLDILGRVYISHEGINAQISLTKNVALHFKQTLFNFSNLLQDIHLNFSIIDSNYSFWVLKVKVKKKLLADGIDDIHFNHKMSGQYLNAIEVNQMFSDKCGSIFVDMRNNYEYAIGHFINAINIDQDTFRDQLKIVVNVLQPYRKKNIVMYCTGGIRCEIATSWLKYHGFNYIYHVKNGIIGYVHEARKKKLPIHFIGKNFVFDARLSEQVSEDVLTVCTQCNCSCDQYVNCKFSSCHLLFIQCRNCIIKFNGCCSFKCQQLFLNQ